MNGDLGILFSLSRTLRSCKGVWSPQSPAAIHFCSLLLAFRCRARHHPSNLGGPCSLSFLYSSGFSTQQSFREVFFFFSLEIFSIITSQLSRFYSLLPKIFCWFWVFPRKNLFFGGLWVRKNHFSRFLKYSQKRYQRFALNVH